MTRRDLLRRLSREELVEWMAFAEVEPFGSKFEEYLAALVASVVAEVNRNKKKRGRPFAPSEFFQDWGEPDKNKATTPEAMFQFIQRFQKDLEVRAGKTSPVDITSKPALVDQYGRPMNGA